MAGAVVAGAVVAGAVVAGAVVAGAVVASAAYASCTAEHLTRWGVVSVQLAGIFFPLDQ